jgi:hypothetical protein
MSKERKPNHGTIMIKRKGETEWNPLISVYAHAFKPTEANPEGTVKLSAIKPEKIRDKEGKEIDTPWSTIKPGDQISLKMDKFLAFLGIKVSVDDEGNRFIDSL